MRATGRHFLNQFMAAKCNILLTYTEKENCAREAFSIFLSWKRVCTFCWSNFVVNKQSDITKQIEIYWITERVFASERCCESSLNNNREKQFSFEQSQSPFQSLKSDLLRKSLHRTEHISFKSLSICLRCSFQSGARDDVIVIRLALILISCIHPFSDIFIPSKSEGKKCKQSNKDWVIIDSILWILQEIEFQGYLISKNKY